MSRALIRSTKKDCRADMVNGFSPSLNKILAYMMGNLMKAMNVVQMLGGQGQADVHFAVFNVGGHVCTVVCVL